MATFHLHDNFVRATPGAIEKVDGAIDATIPSLLLLQRSRFHQRKCPVLKLVGVLLEKLLGTAGIGGFADHLIVFARLQPKQTIEPELHQAHRQVSHVYPNPPSLFLKHMRCRDSRPAPAERV